MSESVDDVHLFVGYAPPPGVAPPEPHVRPLKAECGACQCAIYFDESSQKKMESVPNAELRCIKCAKTVARVSIEFPTGWELANLYDRALVTPMMASARRIKRDFDAQPWKL